VTGRERGAGEACQRRQVRAGAVDDDLDEVGEAELATDRQADVERDRRAPVADELEGGHRHRADDHERGPTELADEAHHLRRGVGGVLRGPLGERSVGAREPGAGAHHHEHDAGRSGARGEHHTGRGEETGRRGPRVGMVLVQAGCGARVPSEPVPDGAPRQVRISRVQPRPGSTPSQPRDRRAGGHPDADDRARDDHRDGTHHVVRER
jgi:hypothetical protein